MTGKKRGSKEPVKSEKIIREGQKIEVAGLQA
jgi:hypothetical protein